MSRTTMIILSIAVLLLVFLACAGLSAYIYTTMPSQNPVDTQVAQTIDVALTQTALAQPATMAPIVLPSSTATSPFPTQAFPITPSATQLPPIVFTFTPAVPQIWVSVDTNCRVGPGKIYDRVGYLLVGQVSEIYGRNPAGDYWYIRNLNNTTAYCWLWGEYATVSGNIPALPVFTPPPTPTPMPDFEVDYASKDFCTGWWVDLKLQNTGGATFRSMTLTVRDTVSGISQTLYADSFTDVNGCTESFTNSTLNPGTNRIVSSTPFGYDLTGHLLRATVTLCTNTGQSGTCLTQSTEFTP